MELFDGPGKYCVDANVFITLHTTTHHPDVFPTLWGELESHADSIILIQPIYDEIDPISEQDKKLSYQKQVKKYPFRIWIEKNFKAIPLTQQVEQTALKLRKRYKTEEGKRGANTNDIKLIAHAKVCDKTIVTLEEKQMQLPKKVSNYKIPLICKEVGVRCIEPIAMLKKLGIKI